MCSSDLILVAIRQARAAALGPALAFDDGAKRRHAVRIEFDIERGQVERGWLDDIHLAAAIDVARHHIHVAAAAVPTIAVAVAFATTTASTPATAIVVAALAVVSVLTLLAVLLVALVAVTLRPLVRLLAPMWMRAMLAMRGSFAVLVFGCGVGRPRIHVRRHRRPLQFLAGGEGLRKVAIAVAATPAAAPPTAPAAASRLAVRAFAAFGKPLRVFALAETLSIRFVAVGGRGRSAAVLVRRVVLACVDPFDGGDARLQIFGQRFAVVEIGRAHV